MDINRLWECLFCSVAFALSSFPQGAADSVLELVLGQSEKLCVNPKGTLAPVLVAPEYKKLNSSPDPQCQPVHLRTARVS